jgi:hypothetical protein
MILDHAVLPGVKSSQFALIDRFYAELEQAMLQAGMTVNDLPPPGHDATVVFFNNVSVEGLGDIRDRVRGSGDDAGRRVTPIVQWMIDHPLAFESTAISRWAALPAFRVAVTCDDDTQLLRLRWPHLRVLRIHHAVWPGALVHPQTLAATHEGRAVESGTGPAAPARDIDVLFAGSIATQEQLDKLRSNVPAQLHPVADEIAQLRFEQPHVTVTQALDLCLPAGLHASDHWELIGRLQMLSVAKVNIQRRLALLDSLQGLRVTVLGGGNWAPHCTGTVTYGGEVRFEDMHHWVKRAKVCLAVNPPQFASGFSERLLLSLAGGAATITDDRPAVRTEFCSPLPGRSRFSATTSPSLRLFHAANPLEARGYCEELLRDVGARATMADAGVRAVAKAHLWGHRLPAILGAASSAVRWPDPGV